MPISHDIANYLNHFFDKILVVSVPRFTERHAAIDAQLKGLHYEFFWGADKLQLDEQFIHDHYDDDKAKKLQRQGKGLNSGEIACSLSHRMLYATVLEQGWKKVLVLEDDAIPLLSNLSLLPEALNALPENWELVYLGYQKHETVTTGLRIKQFFYSMLSRLGLIKWSPEMISNLLPKPYSKHLKKAGFHDCTHAYAINQTAAQKLLQAQTPVIYRADDLLSTSVLKGNLQAFVTEPKFFDQAQALPSEIR